MDDATKGADRQPFFAANDGFNLPDSGERLTAGQSAPGNFAFVYGNTASTYTPTTTRIRGTLTNIPLAAGALARIPGATAVTCNTGDITVLDAISRV